MLAILLTALPGLAAPAFAAEAGSGPAEVTFFFALAVLVVVGRLAGELMQRWGQPAVMGQLIAGLILGPTVFGAVLPSLQQQVFGAEGSHAAMLNAVSQLGILLLLLLTGMETDLNLVRKVGRAAVSVSLAGILLPFACGVGLGWLLPDALLPRPDQRLVVSLFLGTALSISSVKIVAMVVREMDFMRRDLGQVIIASSIIDDSVGWVIIAITFSLATHGALDIGGLALRILGAAAFLGFSFTLGRRIIFTLIRWANDTLVSDMPVISVIIVLMLAMALITNAIGLHTVLGAFVCGVLVGESPILTRHIEAQLRGLILGLFMPVFFAAAGLTADLRILTDIRFLAITGVFILVASLGKGAGAYIGGKIGGLSFRECRALAFAMNARGSTEVIVASIGLSLGMLSHELFTMIVTMAIITTLIMPPTLRWALARIPLGEAEKKRLEREAFEAKGFIANLERVLLTVDESATGRFAARLAGLIAGARGISTTVLQLGRDARAGAETAADAGALVGKAAEAAVSETDEKDVDRPQITVRRSSADPKTAIGDEAARGYDFLFIGLDHPLTESGAFRARIARAAGGFEGATAVLIARGKHLAAPERAAMDILLLTDQTATAMNAAEVALTLARGAAGICALHVLQAGAYSVRDALRGRIEEETVLKNISRIADHVGARVRTELRRSANPGATIVDVVRRGRHDLIVLGTSRRTGEIFDVSPLARAIINGCEASILLVVS